jgi:hypothetical protein
VESLRFLRVNHQVFFLYLGDFSLSDLAMHFSSKSLEKEVMKALEESLESLSST